MTKKFTQSLLSFMLILCLGSVLNPTQIIAQNCDVPTGLSVINLSNVSATLNWTLDSNVDHYRLIYQEVGDSSYNYDFQLTGISHGILSLTVNTTYAWQIRAYCSADDSVSSAWSPLVTFVTTNDPVDCNGTVNGIAFYDGCQNCVGGTTGNIACIDFTPAASISLSTNECNMSADITFITSQDANEPDIASSVFTSDGGAFDFSGLTINDDIGSSVITFTNGSILTTTLMVESIITLDKISVKVVDNGTGVVGGTFTIENSGGGILVDATSPGDNNNITNGNTQTILLNGLFVTPNPSTITFTSTIDSELGDQDIQNTSATIACPPTCPQLGDGNCDGIVDLDDLSLVLVHWLQSTTVGDNGDVVGSMDGFVDLDDLSLVLVNWLQSTQ
jgi:hypothetical protein